jgi:BASS family bile acid:Na+ symporter
MLLLHWLLAALAWLGRQGTRAVAISIFLGLAVPPLAALLKPFVPEAIFLLLCLAFLRVHPSHLRAYVVRPRLLLLGTAWVMVVIPALLTPLFMAFALHERAPGLFLALLLQAAAPPIMAAPAFAALMGLDAALSLAILIASTVATPFTAPTFAELFAGTALTLSPLGLGLRLLLLLAGAAAVAGALRWLAGNRWVEAQKDRIDGINVILLFVFAVAVMDGVVARFLADPLYVVGLIALIFGLTLFLVAATTLVFARLGLGRAFTLGLAAGQRNMGLMLAATGGAVPELTWLYFGLAQFPIYLLPALLRPLARRLSGPSSPA